MNIYGASGHGKVIIDIARSQNISVNCVLDDNPEVKMISGFKVTHEITEDVRRGNSILAIGENRIRKNLAVKFQGKFSEALCHSSAVISPSAILGKGTVVMGNANINAEVVIGEHCIINTGAVVEHDCILGDFVHISPNAALAGNVSVGEGSQVGIGAVVIPGVKIGNWVTIGAGTVVLDNIPDAAVVVGNPGRILKYK